MWEVIIFIFGILNIVVWTLIAILYLRLHHRVLMLEKYTKFKTRPDILELIELGGTRNEIRYPNQTSRIQ